ncbi:MAG: hypothetical protein ACRD7E_16730, partial [Bryobacteraceae bacterium]
MTHTQLFTASKTGAVLLAAISFLTAPAVATDAGKVATDVSAHARGNSVDVIIQFKETPTERHHDKIRGKGGQLTKDLSRAIRGGLYSIPLSQLNELSADPAIEYISPDRPLQAATDYAAPVVGAEMARKHNWDGKAIGVAVIDSGVTPQSDLKAKDSAASRIIYNQSF